MGPHAMVLVFWMLNFKPAFSVSSCTFIKRLFGSSSFSVKAEAPILWPTDVKSQLMGKDHGAEKDWGQVSSAYLRILIFLPAILIPTCPSSSPAFHTMYSAYKLNKQGDNIHPWHIPFSILNQSVVPWPVLTVTSWPAYRFFRRQVRWFGIPISLRIFQFVMIQSVKGFSVVSKAEVDLFGCLLLFLWSNKCWQFDLWFLCHF